MIIHSIVSQDDIFNTEYTFAVSFQNINGGLVELSNNNGVKQIRRLYSTNPHMYLDSRYFPYSNIK